MPLSTRIFSAFFASLLLGVLCCAPLSPMASAKETSHGCHEVENNTLEDHSCCFSKDENTHSFFVFFPEFSSLKPVLEQKRKITHEIKNTFQYTKLPPILLLEYKSRILLL